MKAARKLGLGHKKAWQRPTLPPSSGSTIGAAGLNFRVRDGNGWNPCAIVTRQYSSDSKKKEEEERQSVSYRIAAPAVLNTSRLPRQSVLRFRFAEVQGKIWSSLTVN